MNHKQQNADDELEKEDDATVRILRSPTCRRLFSWGGADDSIPTELSKEARDDQRTRWNFDFMTETPLPGRYQWVRTSETNRSGGEESNVEEHVSKRPFQEEENNNGSKRACSQSQYSRGSEKRRGASESAGSCDNVLNESQDSLHIHDHPSCTG